MTLPFPPLPVFIGLSKKSNRSFPRTSFVPHDRSFQNIWQRPAPQHDEVRDSCIPVMKVERP
jgi:hypothetical protein